MTIQPSSAPLHGGPPSLNHDLVRWSHHLVRRCLDEDPANGFDRREQIELNAHCLEALRDKAPGRWDELAELRSGARLDAPEFRGVREMKNRLSLLICTADESADFRATCSFVSMAALRSMHDAALAKCRTGSTRTAKAARGLLQAQNLGHEHATPRSVVMRILVHRDNRNCDIAGVLDALACRTLLTTREIGREEGIDGTFRSSVPRSIHVHGDEISVHDLPLRFLPLARYFAVSPDLVASLLPIGRRATKLLADFRRVVDAADPAVRRAELARLNAEAGPWPIKCLPDKVFSSDPLT